MYADYKHINTGDTISKSWRLQDGFPLRSKLSLIYHYDRDKDSEKPWTYPTETAFDLFADGLMEISPKVSHLVGKPGEDWQNFSITSFLYPARTGLSLHKDGRESYTGAYTYFLSKHWNIHWGGLLLVLDPRTKFERDEVELYGQPKMFRNVWIDSEREDSQIWEPGFSQCIFPKRNRLVFIDSDTLHMITRVSESAGDNVRMAFSGFFDKIKN